MSTRTLRGDSPPSQDEIDIAAQEIADEEDNSDSPDREERFAWEDGDVTIEQPE